MRTSTKWKPLAHSHIHSRHALHTICMYILKLNHDGLLVCLRFEYLIFCMFWYFYYTRTHTHISQEVNTIWVSIAIHICIVIWAIPLWKEVIRGYIGHTKHWMESICSTPLKAPPPPSIHSFSLDHMRSSMKQPIFFPQSIFKLICIHSTTYYL